MTDLERRALLGDRQAQEECTRQGIVLPCVHGAECRVFDMKVDGKTVYRVVSMNCCCFQGNVRLTKQEALSDWNTRPAPPIGRCGECKHWYKQHCAHGPCATEPTDADFSCGGFEPKGGEENGRTVAN